MSAAEACPDPSGSFAASQVGTGFLRRSVPHINWRARALAAVVILLPFLVVAHFLGNLHIAIQTFHGSDELVFHLPAIMQFASEWPRPVLDDYSSATTPLYHLLFSLLGKVLGFDLYKLRAVNVLISFLAALVYFKLLRAQMGMQWRSALLLTLVFLISPYFFGISFLLLTDNLAWLFGLLAMYGFLASMRNDDLVAWAWGAVCLCLTLLTRQSFAWLLLGAAAVAWVHGRDLSERLIRIAMLGAAALPMLALVVRWHGLVPPSFQLQHEAHSFLNPRAIDFTLAVLGLYYAILNPSALLTALRTKRYLIVGAVVAGLVLLMVLPVGHLMDNDGFLWRVSYSLPSVRDTSVIFWVLVPLGCVALALMLASAPKSVGTLCLLAFSVSVLPSNLLFQKYFDPFIPFFVLLARDKQRPVSRLEGVVLVVLMAGFVMYAFMPYRHPEIYHTAVR
jgi:4-amino-4-deoxy-L-arabinose transferase-like glycosyltransferase